MQSLKSHRYRRIDLPLPGWQQLGHDFSAIGDQDALSQPHAPKIFAQPVLEFADANGVHKTYCSHL